MKTRTVGDVLTQAYVVLNDDAKARYTEAASLSYVTVALQMAKNVRPDLFLGLFGTAIGPFTTTSELPIDDQFFMPIVDYVIARSEMMDAEHVESGRAKLMAELAVGYIT